MVFLDRKKKHENGFRFFLVKACGNRFEFLELGARKQLLEGTTWIRLRNPDKKHLGMATSCWFSSKASKRHRCLGSTGIQ